MVIFKEKRRELVKHLLLQFRSFYVTTKFLVVTSDRGVGVVLMPFHTNNFTMYEPFSSIVHDLEAWVVEPASSMSVDQARLSWGCFLAGLSSKKGKK